MKYSILAFYIVSLILSGCRGAPNDKHGLSDAEIIEASTGNAEYDTLGIAYIMGQFDPALHNGFVEIPIKYADREGLYLRKDALDDFIRMYDAAFEDGIKLQIRSATRNFASQKGIWERKWEGVTILSDGINAAKDITDDKERAVKILEYSSMPGTSRHHWGTDIDLNAFNNEWFAEGEGLVLYNWLKINASSYGFCQPYTPKGELRPSGYNEEKWHWSYMPVSVPLTREARQKLKNNMISGFKGSDQAVAIDVVNNYILGVNPQCK